LGWSNNSSSSKYPRVIRDFATPTAVSTETPLLVLTEYGALYSCLAVTLRNHDASNRAALYIDQSESGTVNDEERETLYVGALRERTIEFRDILRLMWGVSAAGDPDTGFPSVSISWRLVGRCR
jgi:hypothetical protein